jgi:hypothetical protein
VLAEVSSPQFPLLSAGEQAELIIVSPDTRTAALIAAWLPVVKGVTHALYHTTHDSKVLIRDPGYPSSVYRVPAGGETARIPVHLRPGLNRVALVALSSRLPPPAPGAQRLLYVESLSLARSY